MRSEWYLSCPPSLLPMHNTLTHMHMYPPSLTDLGSKLCYPLLGGVGREGGVSGKLLWKSWVLESQQCLEGTKQLWIFPTRSRILQWNCEEYPQNRYT